MSQPEDHNPDEVYKDIPEATRNIVEPLLQEMRPIYSSDSVRWQKLLENFGSKWAGPKGHFKGRQTLWYIAAAGPSTSAREKKTL